MPHTVNVTYFKSTGKFYSSAEYVSTLPDPTMHDIWDEFNRMRQAGKAPGLSGDGLDFFVQIEVPTHPYDHPRMLMPGRWFNKKGLFLGESPPWWEMVPGELHGELVQALVSASNVIGWVSMTRYEREACEDDINKIDEVLKKVGHNVAE